MPLLLLVQQVGDGEDTAQPPPCCTDSSRVGVSQQSVPSQWLLAARGDGEPTGAKQQPLHTLEQGWGLGCPSVLWGWHPAVDGGTGKEMVTLRSRCCAPHPLYSSLALGRREMLRLTLLSIPQGYAHSVCGLHMAPRGWWEATCLHLPQPRRAALHPAPPPRAECHHKPDQVLAGAQRGCSG